jgi:stearoyl-CoA desaturase (delta-9 desaturase)
MTKLSLDTKVKLLQASVHVILLATLIASWNLNLFLIGLAVGWVFWLIGVNAGLHKFSSHKCYTPKNKACAILILYVSNLCSLGSNISWACTHRKHHQYTDQDEDPHSPNTHGGGLWRSIRLWFYYFPTYHINPRTVKDLTIDPMHKWFHKYYFHTIIAYGVVLAFFDWTYVGYLFALPAFYVFTGINYITVLAHLEKLGNVIGHRSFETTDKTYDNKLMSILLPGEGNHNTHHALPGAVSNAMRPGDIDLGLWFIKLVGRISTNQDYYQRFVV